MIDQVIESVFKRAFLYLFTEKDWKEMSLIVRVRFVFDNDIVYLEELSGLSRYLVKYST
jgi:hypothetical protein